MTPREQKTAYTFDELLMKPTRITQIVDEADRIKSFGFAGALDSHPGQFVVLWMADAGSRPFSVYRDHGSEFVLTIANVGGFTERLFESGVGESLGYFGPFGKAFDLRGTHLAMVGGGYGAAPLSFLAERASRQGLRCELIIGADSRGRVLYADRDDGPCVTKHYCTEDGSLGSAGLTTDRLRELLEADPSIDMVYTAGPELMMKQVVDLCDTFDVDGQISLERHMKCGFGICGSCCVDPDGLRMCVEGPCIDKETAKAITEFGRYHRDAAGIKQFFKEE